MSLSVNHLGGVLIFSLVLVGCSWQQGAGPGTLVIAVENLAFERVGCESSDLTGREFESFRTFCEDGVRFTHAYTTSTLAQPALASILTGLYPLEHGLRTNGADGLAARFETVAERAVAMGARTALFSGGPPILRKSGLAQGFELFDDHFGVNESRFYRPALDLTKSFLSWLDRESPRKGFFALLYLADLQFPKVATTSDLAEVRERSQDSQTREVAESLSTLIAEMRRRDLWHRTHVVLVGMNGQSARPGEIPPLNLYADNTQVALFFKPARRGRDQGPQWTIDKNVSLADLGHSLFEMMGGSAPESVLTQLPRVSLFRLADQTNANWEDDRLILIESGWGSWRAVSGVRLAARRRQYFYIHDTHPRLYNTLIDRLETNPLPIHDPLWQTLELGILDFFSSLDIPRWSISDDEELERLMLGQKWWSIENVGRISSQDSQLRKWQAQRYLETENWNALEQLGESSHDLLYRYVGGKNLNHAIPAPIGVCARYFSQPYVTSESTCEDEAFVHLLEWKGSRDRTRRDWMAETVARDFRTSRLSSVTGAANYSRYLPWDVSLRFPIGVDLVQLFLALPDNRQLAKQIQIRNARDQGGLDL